MSVPAGQLLHPLADAAAGEQTTPLLDLATPRSWLRIERIVSAGQASPEGFWYDQDHGEFVLLLAGSAALRIERERRARELVPGDYVFLPPHCRHRVERSSADPPAVWLALHLA